MCIYAVAVLCFSSLLRALRGKGAGGRPGVWPVNLRAQIIRSIYICIYIYIYIHMCMNMYTYMFSNLCDLSILVSVWWSETPHVAPSSKLTQMWGKPTILVHHVPVHGFQSNSYRRTRFSVHYQSSYSIIYFGKHLVQRASHVCATDHIIPHEATDIFPPEPNEDIFPDKAVVSGPIFHVNGQPPSQTRKPTHQACTRSFNTSQTSNSLVSETKIFRC